MEHLFRRYIHLLCVAILGPVILWSCGKASDFSATVTFESLPTQNVEIYVFTPEGISYRSVAAIDGKLSFRASAPELSMVEMYSRTGSFLGRFPVKNGDDINAVFSGSGSLTLKGNKAAERYAELLRSARASGPDKASESASGPVAGEASRVAAAFIEKNPSDELSPLVLEYMFDMSADPAEAIRLATLIRDSGRDESRMSDLITTLASSGGVELKKIDPVMLMVPGDTVATLDFSESPYTLLYFSSRERLADTLVNMIDVPKRLRVAVIREAFDTVMWSKSRSAYTRFTPEFFWAPAGPATPGLDRFGVPSLPWVSLVDSAANEIYRGPSAADAAALADSLLNRPKHR